MDNKSLAIMIIIVVILTLPLLALTYANSLQPDLYPIIPAPTPGTPHAAGPFPAAYAYNWAGYALTGPTGWVSQVKGNWTVPTYTGASCNPYEWWDSSFWIGMDGFNSNTVEQTGTETGCFKGLVYYDAWYEFYPSSSVIISHTIYPKDNMSAEVNYVSGVFIVSIQDTTSGHKWSFTTTATVSGVKRSSAEWIAESPIGGALPLGILPLADFGTAHFIGGTAVTTTHSGTIGSFPNPKIQVITAVCFPSNTPNKATPTALSKTGANFNVTWVNPGPQG